MVQVFTLVITGRSVFYATSLNMLKCEMIEREISIRLELYYTSTNIMLAYLGSSY